ncbi:hypothetical protein D0U04_07010 [Bacillus clarus]|nr:hypothetical protein D0U04_07010 [Bacillus clarus]
MFRHFLDGMSCVRCGGPATLKPYNPVKKQTDQSKNKGPKIQVNADTTEALERIKEVTEAANECVFALEKLEKVMDKFKGKSETLIQFDTVLDGRTIANQINKVTREEIRAKQF